MISGEALVVDTLRKNSLFNLILFVEQINIAATQRRLAGLRLCFFKSAWKGE
jgi:hypothetical protein